MKPSNDLFLLIKSMSQSEKRSFNLDAKRYKDGKKKYIAMFEAMQKVSEYDEEAVKKSLASEVSAGNFASLKNRLWQMLKQFLREDEKGRTASGKGFSLVEAADILQKRGLVDAAKKELKAAARLAEELDLIDLKLQINEVWRNLFVRYQSKKIEETWQDLREERKQLIAIKIEEEEQARVYYDLSMQMRKDFDLRPENNLRIAKGFLQEPVLSSEVQPRTFRGKRLQLMSRAFCFHALKKLKEEALEYEKIIDLWESHPAHQKEFSNHYRLALCNYLHISAQAQNYERLSSVLDQLDKLPVNNEDEEIESVTVSGLYRLLLFINNKNISAAKEFVEGLSESFDRFGAKINPSTRIGMLLNFTLVNFFDEDYKTTLHWIERVFQESSDHRIDLQGFARIVEVLVMVDQKSPSLVKSRAKSAQEWLRSKNRLLPFENTVLNTLRTMGRNAVGDWPPFYQKLLDRLHDLEREKGNVQGMEDVCLWCRARIARVSMKDIMRMEDIKNDSGQGLN